MAKGYLANRERQEAIAELGKDLARRAKFTCEWCEGKGDLRPWEYSLEAEPTLENLALLCGSCRELAEGKKVPGHELYVIRSALWSPIPAVAIGAARVLSRCTEPWAREAIEESLIDEAVKQEFLGVGWE